MSKYQNYKVKPAQFLTMATNVLYRTLVDSPRTEAKKVFNAVIEGKQVALITVRMDDETEVRFDLSLDHSEFRGQRINFKSFRNSLRGLVGALGESLRSESELPVFTEEGDGSMLFGVPGLTTEDGELNVMMLAANMRTPGRVQLKLQYMYPDQFFNKQAD